MQRQQFNPDIQLKFQQLLQHMTQKNTIIEQFLRILRQICDAQIFYSRSMDKFANNISKLMVGKDPLKEVFIIYERAVAAKSQQSMELANNIKDDMIPFIEQLAIDLKEQNQLKNKQKTVKDIKQVITHKLRNLRVSQNYYKRSYDTLKKYAQAQSRAQIQQRQRLQKHFTSREAILMQSINSYNHTVEEYLLQYTGICQKLSDIQTKRKTCLRDAINKYMIFQISCIKNLEYNIPRYMKSLEKMSQKLIIQDKISNNMGANSSPNPYMVNLAKISISNYIAGLNDKQKIDIPSSHKKILQIKKNTEAQISKQRYHQLVEELYVLLDETKLTFDVRVLKEIVYFSRNVRAEIFIHRRSQKVNGGKSQRQSEQNSRETIAQGGQSSTKIFPKTAEMCLLEAILCHQIFHSAQFWSKYQQKLMDIIDRQSRSLPMNNKQLQISLNFLAADIEFLKIVAEHPRPAGILAKFSIGEEKEELLAVKMEEGKESKENMELEGFLERNLRFVSL